MSTQGSGLTDKLYWRRAAGRWHCFKRTKWRGCFKALCNPDINITKVGGQDIRRPIPLLRCARCDGREMKRRGWEESGPETVGTVKSMHTPDTVRNTSEKVCRAQTRRSERLARRAGGTPQALPRGMNQGDVVLPVLTVVGESIHVWGVSERDARRRAQCPADASVRVLKDGPKTTEERFLYNDSAKLYQVWL